MTPTKNEKTKKVKSIDTKPKNLPKVEVPLDEDIAEILQKRSLELKEKEEQKKEAEKKEREVAKDKRKAAGTHHQAKDKKVATVRKKPRHGAKYRSISGLVEAGKIYPLVEAVSLVKKLSTAKFDASIDAHVGVTDTNVRGIVHLPHGSSKKIRVAIASDNLIAEITKGRIDFDVLVTAPEFMPRLAKVAKILGPKGLMPTPKNGTISEKPEKVQEEIAGGRLEFRADKDRVIHKSIGRVSWPDKNILENCQALLAGISASKVKSIYLAPTMGPSVKTKLLTN